MNKLKVMYDVVKTMKSKEVFKGTLKVEGKKGEEKFVNVFNEFERNLTTGQVKTKVNTEFNCEGKSFKHESNTDFNMGGGSCQGPHGFMKHMHMHRHEHNFGEGKSFGPKAGLNKIGFALGILNSIKLEENEDKSAVLKLKLMDLPEEMKEMFHEKMKKGNFHENHGNEEFQKHFGGEGFKGHHTFMKELHSLTNPNVEINVFINGNSEVEKVLIIAEGKLTTEGETREVELKAEINLAW